MKLKYTKDICGNDLLTDENEEHQIMMEWEVPYMKESIKLFQPRGNVLEIGFGMGYSATQICEMDEVTSYTVIECSPNVWNKFEEWKREIQEKKDIEINLIKGRWQDILETTGKYDSIYFDDYNGDNMNDTMKRFNKFMYEIISDNHVSIGSRICAYSTTNQNTYHNVNCLSFNCFDYKIKIPSYCNYAKGEEMYIPIFTIISEPDYDLKKKILGNYLEINKKISDQIEQAKIYYNKPKSIYCNLLVIDNFYTNAMETRNFILTQEFSVKGNYPGQRTVSYATQEIKNMIEGYISSFTGKIVDWPEGGENYNGSYQYTTSRDRTWIHTDSHNNWAGVLYLTPNAPVTSGTGIYRFKDGTRFEEEKKIRNNDKQLNELSQDYTKWELVDQVGNIFNRLVLFNSKQFHASLDYFGTNKENGRLFQVFFFTTER